MPALAVGATNHLLEAPDLDEIFDRVPRDGVDSLFFPPTVWVGLANHPRLAEAELDGLRNAFYGASIMPVPVLHKLQARLPNAGFFNCFGQSEIGPLATVLRPEEHAARPDSVGRAVLFVETRVVDPDFNDVAADEVGDDGLEVITLDREPGCTFTVDVTADELPDLRDVDVRSS